MYPDGTPGSSEFSRVHSFGACDSRVVREGSDTYPRVILSKINAIFLGRWKSQRGSRRRERDPFPSTVLTRKFLPRAGLLFHLYGSVAGGYGRLPLLPALSPDGTPFANPGGGEDYQPVGHRWRSPAARRGCQRTELTWRDTFLQLSSSSSSSCRIPSWQPFSSCARVGPRPPRSPSWWATRSRLNCGWIPRTSFSRERLFFSVSTSTCSSSSAATVCPLKPASSPLHPANSCVAVRSSETPCSTLQTRLRLRPVHNWITASFAPMIRDAVQLLPSNSEPRPQGRQWHPHRRKWHPRDPLLHARRQPSAIPLHHPTERDGGGHRYRRPALRARPGAGLGGQHDLLARRRHLRPPL